MKTHNFAKELRLSNKAYRDAIFKHTVLALEEDLGENGDITSDALLDSSKKVSAVLLTKQSGILAGTSELRFFLREKTQLRLLKPLKDGAKLRQGLVIGVLRGRAGEILKLERTILNFLQRMSGVATMARAYVEKCMEVMRHGGGPLVCATRKTPWGLLDKRACVVGGAGTHRLNLSDAVLVKDTHLDLIGHDFEVLEQKLLGARALGRFVEIEAESVQEGLKAVELLREVQKKRRIPCFVMLDNMKVEDVRRFMAEIRCPRASLTTKNDYQQANKIFVEASGGITLANIQKYARTGVDILSVGAMTNSASALDISLKIM